MTPKEALDYAQHMITVGAKYWETLPEEEKKPVEQFVTYVLDYDKLTRMLHDFMPKQGGGIGKETVKIPNGPNNFLSDDFARSVIIITAHNHGVSIYEHYDPTITGMTACGMDFRNGAGRVMTAAEVMDYVKDFDHKVTPYEVKI